MIVSWLISALTTQFTLCCAMPNLHSFNQNLLTVNGKRKQDFDNTHVTCSSQSKHTKKNNYIQSTKLTLSQLSNRYY